METKTRNNKQIVGCVVFYAVHALLMGNRLFFLHRIQCECTAMTDAAVLNLQNSADLVTVQVRGLCGDEMFPPSSHDAYQAISIKAEVPADAEEDPLATTISGAIKTEPKVSCISVSMLGRLHKYRYTSFQRQSMYLHFTPNSLQSEELRR
jgi:hypothetical protein